MSLVLSMKEVGRSANSDLDSRSSFAALSLVSLSVPKPRLVF